MIKPLHALDIFLHPGDYYFADRDTRICTVLGSGVAITFWHPQLLMGGMCHCMLSERGSERRIGDWAVPDGLYADAAIALLLEEIGFVGTSHKEYRVKLLGGGSLFPGADSKPGIRNIQAARRLAKKFGFNCVAEHLGGIGYCNVSFEVWSGEVWLKHCNALPIAEYEYLSRSLI